MMEKYGRKWQGVKAACKATKDTNMGFKVVLTYYTRLDCIIHERYKNSSPIRKDCLGYQTLTDHPLTMQQIIDRFMVLLKGNNFENYPDG